MLTPLEALLVVNRFEGARQRYKESVGKLNQLNVAHLSPEMQAERQGLIEDSQKVPPMLEQANAIVASYRLAQDKNISDQQAETLKTVTDTLNTYVTNVHQMVRSANLRLSTLGTSVTASASFDVSQIVLESKKKVAS